MSEDSATPPVVSDAGADHPHHDHLRREGWTMALYVAVCLIAALTALENVLAVPGQVLGVVWGTTIGLALAHLFAFRVAGRLVHEGSLPKSDQIAGAVQLGAAAAVAVLVSIPVLIAQPANELDWARYTCAGIIGVVGYGAARGAEQGRMRALIFGVSVLVVAMIIAAIKHRMAGH